MELSPSVGMMGENEHPFVLQSSVTDCAAPLWSDAKFSLQLIELAIAYANAW